MEADDIKNWHKVEFDTYEIDVEAMTSWLRQRASGRWSAYDDIVGSTLTTFYFFENESDAIAFKLTFPHWRRRPSD